MNIEIVYGKSKSFEIVVADDNGLVDLTGKSLSFDAKYSYLDADPPAIVKALVPKNQGTDLGEATLHLTPTDSDVGNPARTTVLYYQVTLTDGTDKYIVESGKLTVRPVVDRP